MCKEEFIAAVKFEPRICSNIGIFVEHEFMNIGLKWTICLWGLRNNEQSFVEKAKLDFAGQSINRGRRKIRESGCQKFRHDEERREERRERIPGARANVKTHLVHPHTRASGSRRVPTPTAKIPTEQPMTGMTCTRCRTEHLLSSSSPPSSLLPLPPQSARLSVVPFGQVIFFEGGAGLI